MKRQLNRNFKLFAGLTVFFALLTSMFAFSGSYGWSWGMLVCFAISAFCAHGEYTDSKRKELRSQSGLNLATSYRSAPEGDNTLND